ncbi:hypothetical protein [Jiangella alba]|uniref:Repeat domain-containing protein n=1 Tax=Jiangella alba TaxID=561176 RepID=A0A1H5MDT1_9ACTN|nr:hypothetical protein [Jiangella alba]SEE87230.1 hypothetical protein SAMN04488561_3090 [Jiangella alba]
MPHRRLFRNLIAAATTTGIVAASVGVSAAPALAVAPEDGTVIQLADGSYLPIMPVTGHSPVEAVGYRVSGGQLRAYDQDGVQLWARSTTGTQLSGGYDFDADGWPDVAVTISANTGSTCGVSPLTTTTLHFYQGATGTQHTPLSPMNDICWSFPGTTPYPTHQWSELAPLWGDETSTLFTSPYYATTSWYLGFGGGSFSTAGALYYPSTSSYDSTYPNAQPNTYPTGTDYIQYAHVANGLITSVAGQNRAVFWTSGRVVQYAIGALSSGQLIADRPYLTGGRTDIAGRNYGLVAVDPGSPNSVVLLSGTSNYSLYQDAITGTQSYDVWGGIERHVSIYDAAANTVQDRFFSYAHDASDGHKYQNRVSYPAHPFVQRSGASRLAYNVFRDGRWRLHVSQPGSTTSLYELDDVFLWDIVDVDGDGTQEWLISPTRNAGEPLGPAYYFPKWQTSAYHWNESALTLTSIATFADAIPALQRTFATANTSSSDGSLAPAHVVADGGVRELLVRTSSGTVERRTL